MIFPLPPSHPNYIQIKKLLNKPTFLITIVFLVVFSVGLVVLEVFAGLSEDLLRLIDVLQSIIIALLVVELYLRWLVSSGLKKFIQYHWIDILALLPMLRVFRLGRLILLLRLLRLFSLGVLVQRRLICFSSGLSSRLVEYGFILGFTVLAILFGAVGLAQFELGHGVIETKADAFWQATFSLVAGEYADVPESLGGKIVALVLLILGMGLFAMLTGTISAVMIDKLKENRMQKIDDAENLFSHVVICGFSPKVAILVKELQLSQEHRGHDILIVSEHANIQELRDNGVNTESVYILREDFPHIEVLKKAGISKAVTAIILSETNQHRSTHDVDARTILTALTIERINPNVHTCCEIFHAEYVEHLKIGGVDDVILHGDVSGRLLARIGVNKGILIFFNEILDTTIGNTIGFLDMKPEWQGRDIKSVMSEAYEFNAALIVGVKSVGCELMVNPPSDYILQKGDQMLVVCLPDKLYSGFK